MRRRRHLKISHQFPGGTIDPGDFRDRLVRKFAQDVEKRTNGALKFDIYPNSSLVKVNSQFSALRRGALDLSLVPISYSGGEVPETNIGLLPALVPSYEVGSKWKNAEVGKFLSQILAEKGVLVVTWIWQAGGVASRTQAARRSRRREGHEGARRQPRDGHDVQGCRRVRAVAAVERDLRGDADRRDGRGAHVVDEPHLVPARGGVEGLTSGRGKSYWFMFEPLLMSKQVFDKLPKPQQDAIMAVGAELEKFAVDSAMADDKAVAGVYVEGGRQGVRPRRGDAQEVAGARAARLEGLRRQERELREAARAGREAVVSAARLADAQASGLPGAPQRQARAPRAAGMAASPRSRSTAAVDRAINVSTLFVGMVALLVASFVLTYSVFSRYLFHAATDWQDEVAVFCIVGAVFLAGAWVQSQRGHVGIEAVASILPARVNRLRDHRGRPDDARVLRVLRVEVVDAVPRGVGRQDDDVVDLRAAAHDSVRPDGDRHDAARRSSSLLQTIGAFPPGGRGRADERRSRSASCSAA